MTTIQDAEFGEIVIRRTSRASRVRIRIGTDGRYVASAPRYTPIFFITRMIASSRDELRKLATHSSGPSNYHDKQSVGRTHTLAVVPTGMVAQPTVRIERNRIIVLLPNSHLLEDRVVQQLIRDNVAKVLRKEAKIYLPSRLAAIAAQYEFTYERVHFRHSGGRWGSCSSTGTISLNIALMKLSDELIDYVLAHELSHTRHMNHSSAFWQQVSAIDPHYKLHRRQLARETPTV
ncbi:M48 family peptidase [Candidatus Saccharibacteria bacterium]|nr:M48 family peptidase [Candidatus Saccharibacteria bacterium]